MVDGTAMTTTVTIKAGQWTNISDGPATISINSGLIELRVETADGSVVIDSIILGTSIYNRKTFIEMYPTKILARPMGGYQSVKVTIEAADLSEGVDISNPVGEVIYVQGPPGPQ